MVITTTPWTELTTWLSTSFYLCTCSASGRNNYADDFDGRDDDGHDDDKDGDNDEAQSF